MSVLAVGLILSAPHPAIIGPPPAALSRAQAIEIDSASGARLHGWWIPSAHPGGGAVVLLHGVWESRLQMVRRAAFLQDHGFSVLLFDFQAHGESGGRHITYGRLEALDAASAVAFVRQHAPREKIAAIGFSLGGAATLLGPQPLPVDALVLEAVYPDIDDALAHRLRAHLGPLLGPLVTPMLTAIFKVVLPPILGVAPSDLRPIDRIGAIRVPVLVASGTKDDRTPIEEARALYDHAPEPKIFWAVPGAGHVDFENYDPTDYWRVTLPFLTRYLRPALAAQ